MKNKTKKIITFSLWGDSKIYNYGAVENAIIAKDLYPDWECWFYLGKGVLKNVKQYLEKMPNVKIIDKSAEENSLGNMLWRFEPVFKTKHTVIIRDCDSRLNMREKLAVDEWLNSNKDFHIMRDNKFHYYRILGGMWGARNGSLMEFKDIYKKFISFNKNVYNYDQDFLRILYHWKIGENALVHASFNKHEKTARDFPKSNYKGFVGEIIENCSIAAGLFGDKEKICKHPRTSK